MDPWDLPAPPRRGGRWLPAVCGGLAFVLFLSGLAWIESESEPVVPPGPTLWLAALALAGCALSLRLMHRQRRLQAVLQAAGHSLADGRWQDAAQPLSAEDTGAARLAAALEATLGDSERRWRSAQDLSAEWLWETDRQGRITWLSTVDAAPGLGADAMLGRPFDQVPVFDAPAPGWAVLNACVARLEPFDDLEFVARTSAGPRWLSISGRPRRDARGRLLGYEGIGRDISDWRAAHERLVENEQRWSMMARLAADGYWQTDAEHRLRPLSAEQQRRIGERLAEHIEGRTLWDAYPQAMSAASWAEHRADLEGRRPFRSLQLEVEVEPGRCLWISLSGAPRFDASGRFVGYHGVGRDITGRKEAERLLLRHNEALQRAVDERTRDLQQMNRDLDAFARQLAHELRTPIAHVLGLAQLLADRAGERLTGDDRGLIDLQVQAGHRMRETVDALLALARSTLQPMPQQALDLSALVHEAAQALPASPRRAPLRFDAQPGMRVQGNPAALKIVLDNLLGNAAKFTRDVDAPRVRVRLAPDADGRLRIGVEDNGIGFDPARAGQLFRPFSRLHTRDDYLGSGIGLSIVQRIVERHGGTVAASARPGQGACFEFTLPAPADLRWPATAFEPATPGIGAAVPRQTADAPVA